MATSTPEPSGPLTVLRYKSALSVAEWAIKADIRRELFYPTIIMAKIPSRIGSRLSEGIRRYQPIIAAARARDVGEADTVTIVKDFLADVLGYDKYSELTSEHAIRGTYCDLAVKIDGTLGWLIEVKSAGLDLKEQHIKQAVDYAANQGCEWVVLTNACTWMIFRLRFTKPIEHNLVATVDVSNLNPKKSESLDLLWILSREGWKKSHLESFAEEQELLSKYTVAAVIQSDAIVGLIRRELRRINPNARIAEEDVLTALHSGVIRREVVEGEQADRAKKLVSRSAKKSLREPAASTPSEPAHHQEADAIEQN